MASNCKKEYTFDDIFNFSMKMLGDFLKSVTFCAHFLCSALGDFCETFIFFVFSKEQGD